MTRFFLHLLRGHFRQHRLEAFLCLLGVALGVAVVVAMDAAVDACIRSFSGAVDSLAERSTHSIFATAGGIPDDTYIALLKRKLPVPLAPVIDRGVMVRSPTHAAVLGRFIGVDVFAERSLRSFTKMQSSLNTSAFDAFLTQPGALVLVDALATELHVKVGDPVTLDIGAHRMAGHVVGIVQPVGVARAQLTNLIIADLATAQEMADCVGSVDRIDTSLTSPEQIAQLSAALPHGLVLQSTQQRANSLGQLIGSYRMNLGALSLMASFVAVFIVYNSMLISVQQRAKSLGILRCLGASRATLAGIYFTEALLFAVGGGVLGVLGGWGLSKLLVGYISTTINDLYASIRPGTVTLDGTMWAKGIGAALVSCLIGAAVPLWSASRVTPVNLFRSSGSTPKRSTAVWLLVEGVGLLVASVLVYKLPGDSPIAGFVMALLVAVGFALVCPLLIRLGCDAVNALARWWQLLPLQLAAAQVGRSLGITAVAVAATMLAMSMNIGIRTMVASFRDSLGTWFDHRFDADVFVAPELTIQHHLDATLDPAVVAWVSRQPETAHVSAYRSFTVPVGKLPTLLVGTNLADERTRLPMKFSAAIPPEDHDPRIEISEPLAGRMKLSAGDTLQIDSPTGLHNFFIADVFYDFGNEHGQILMDRPILAADWRDDQINDLHVTLKPGNDRTAVAARWATALRANYPVVVNSFDSIKVLALAVFDRTFSVTVVLTWLSGAVAFCGLAGSLLALALARRRDYSTLAALGMTGRQTAAWVLGQGVLIAWASAVVAPVTGTVLADVLAYVIQYRSFGWSIPTHPEPRFWVQNFLLATAAAGVAAVYPVLRLKGMPPAMELRAE